jgi:NAD(P)-dependent dehydrogenase (short-subunit alcohol dehydrogenase family)
MRVLITGARGGIGTAATAALRARGATVLGLDLVGDGADVLACDVRDQAAVDRAVAEAIARLGGLDVLINNAGLGIPQSAGEAPDADALAVIDVNLLGPWRVTAAALPALRATRGRVVNVASGLAYVSVPFAPAYCASKRGLVAYSDALRLEHGDAITVTTVYPGYIRTPIHTASQEEGFALEGVIPAEPLDSAAETLVRTALGPPRRDLATTRSGTGLYLLARTSPRRIVDSVISGAVRRSARRGRFDRSALAREFVERARA